MKFGEFLKANRIEEWGPFYLDYDNLKKMISMLEEKQLNLTSDSKCLP
jgi:SPX domain protein involved in polyphosphate accumulation